MKYLFSVLSFSVLLIACQPKAVTAPHSEKTNSDWLVNPERSSAFVEVSDDGKELTIDNAMVSRTFRLQNGKSHSYRLIRDYTVELTVAIPANGYTWYAVE